MAALGAAAGGEEEEPHLEDLTRLFMARLTPAEQAAGRPLVLAIAAATASARASGEAPCATQVAAQRELEALEKERVGLNRLLREPDAPGLTSASTTLILKGIESRCLW